MNKGMLRGVLAEMRKRRALAGDDGPLVGAVWDDLIVIAEALLQEPSTEEKGMGEHIVGDKSKLKDLRQRLRNKPAPGGTAVMVSDLQPVIDYLVPEEDVETNVQDTQGYGRSPAKEYQRDMNGVAKLGEAMRYRLQEKNRQGRFGWYDPTVISTSALAGMLRLSVEKGDPVDVANYAMMLYNRDGRTNEGMEKKPQEVTCRYVRLPDIPSKDQVWWSTYHQMTVTLPMTEFSNCPHCGAKLDLWYDWHEGLPGTHP